MKNKSDIAYEFIKDSILKNTLNSGDVISENQVAEKLNISRSPVRTAFQKLSAEGFITILPSRGAIVQEMSVQEAHDIYDLRIAVETFVLKRAFEYITPEDITKLQEIINQQETAYLNGDPQKSMDYDMQFHSYFASYYSNKKFEEVIRNFRERFASYGYIALTKPGRIHSTLQEHKAIVEALGSKDLPAAINNLEKHFETAKKFLMLK